MQNDLNMINGPDNLNRKGNDQRPVKIDSKVRSASPSDTATSSADDADRVSLSAKAEAVLETSQSSAVQTDRQRDLEAIKTEISEGRYKIDAKLIAEKLIHHESLVKELRS